MKTVSNIREEKRIEEIKVDFMALEKRKIRIEYLESKLNWNKGQIKSCLEEDYYSMAAGIIKRSEYLHRELCDLKNS